MASARTRDNRLLRLRRQLRRLPRPAAVVRARDVLLARRDPRVRAFAQDADAAFEAAERDGRIHR